MTQALYLLCAIAGFILTVGSLLLIWKGRIVVDAEAKQITSVELPLGIKLQTNLPMVAMFLFGGALLAFPIWQAARAERPGSQNRAYLNGKIESPEPVRAAAVADEKYDIIGEFNLQVPLTECQYTIIYTARNGVTRLGQEIVNLKSDQTNYTLRGPNARLESPPNNPLSELKAPIREESKASLAEFKPVEGGAQ